MNDYDISIIIVDDEENNREMLSIMMETIDGANVVDTAGTVDEAVKKIMIHRPDLIFLDIHMPGKDGFELVKILRNNQIECGVIFTTILKDQAVRAIKMEAFDYLEKPIDIDMLQDAIERFRLKLWKSRHRKAAGGPPPSMEKLRFNTRTGFVLIDQEEIIYTEAEGNYTTIFLTKKNKEVVTVPLKKIEEMLNPANFLRISKSLIINLNLLKKVDRTAKTCQLERNGESFQLHIPPNNIKMLEDRIKA